MIFLDEKIALIQKKSRLLKRDKEISNCNENVQESEVIIERKDVTELYDFKQEYYFDNQVSLLIPQDFFDSTTIIEDKIVWQKNQVMEMILLRQDILDKEILPVEALIKALQEQYKKQEFYVDFLDSWEQENGSLRKQIISSRIPTSKGYMYQKQLNLISNQKCTLLMITCFEKDRFQFEILLEYILDHIRG